MPPFSGPGSPGSCVVCKIKNLSIRSIPVHDNRNFYARLSDYLQSYVSWL